MADRLSSTKFHLGIASDLSRAWNTAQAFVAANPSLEAVEECHLVRERNGGLFDGDHALCNAQYKVEEAIEDRELLTWRIPGGESVVDLRERVRAFLQVVQAKAMALCVDARVLPCPCRNVSGFVR